MKTGIAIVISLLSLFYVQAQQVNKFEDMDSFCLANQPLVKQLAKHSSFNEFTKTNQTFIVPDPVPDVMYIYVGDFNKDGKNDVIFNTIYFSKADNDGPLTSSLWLYVSTEDRYLEYKVGQVNFKATFDLRLTEVDLDDDKLILTITDFTDQIYRRVTKLMYEPYTKRFLITDDGGEGVFFPGNAYEEINDMYLLDETYDFTKMGQFNRYAPVLVDLQRLRYWLSRKTVTVKTYKEFLYALGSNTEIILDMPQLNLSDPAFKKELLDFKKNTSLRHRKVDYTSSYEGTKPYALVLKGFTDLTIRGKGLVEVISTAEDDEIISFENCENIQIANLNFYHQVGVNPCGGGVSNFSGCDDVMIENCYFNGSGIIGINLQHCDNVQVKKSAVYNNSHYALYMRCSNNVVFEQCEFYANEVQEYFIFQEKSDVTISQSHLHHNSSYKGFINPLDDDSELVLEHCRIETNNFSMSESAVAIQKYHLKTGRLTAGNTRLSQEQLEAKEYFRTNLEPPEEITALFSALTRAENRRNLDDVLNSYAYPVQQYWEKTHVDSNQMAKIYRDAWGRHYFSESTLQQTLDAGNNRYYQDIVFLYRTNSQPEILVKTHNVLRVETDESGKITSVQKEPDGIVKLKRMNTLVDWANAVNRQQVDSVLTFFRYPIQHFENQTESDEAHVAGFYRDLWRKFRSVKLQIDGIVPTSTDTYELTVDYYFEDGSEPVLNRRLTYTIVFSGEKIIEMRTQHTGFRQLAD